MIDSLRERFQNAVDDDFNFAGGLAVLFEIAKELGKEGNLLVHQGKIEIPGDQLQAQWHILVELAGVLGFAAQPEDGRGEWPFASTDGLSNEEIENLVQQRTEARLAKNWAQSDRIRDELQALGITLIDKPGGVTVWHRT